MFTKDTFSRVRKQAEAVVGAQNVRADNGNLALYSYDSGLSRARPEAVIHVLRTEQLAPLIKLLAENDVPFVPRGAGTNLTGGCVPLKGGVIINTAALNRILEVDTASGYALAEPGAVNGALQRELARENFFFAPAPESAAVSTIGGNMAENCRGPRAFKYGPAGASLLEAEFVSPEGETLRWSASDAGPLLARFFAGSEGSLGAAARLRVKILKSPAAVCCALIGFRGPEGPIDAARELVAAGIIPRAAIGMDNVAASASDSLGLGAFPPESAGALFLELDAASEDEMSAVCAAAEKICAAAGAGPVVFSRDAEGRAALRLRADVYTAMARLAPNAVLEDMAVPPASLAVALAMLRHCAAKFDARAALVYHPASGVLRPQLVFDERNSFEAGRIKKAAREMLKCAVTLGGLPACGFGSGVDKRMAMHWIYDNAALELFRRIKKAADPRGIANPDKIIPVAGAREGAEALQERAQPSRAAAAVAAELASRFAAGRASFIAGHGAAPSGAAPLDTGALDGVEIDRANRSAEAEACVPVARLKAKAAEHGLRLRLPDYPGGIGALAASGRCAALREIITGIKFALADGSVIRAGGKCAVDPPGTDVISLMCGSRGAYGVILSLTLRADGAADCSALAARREFSPGPYHRRLKRAFDPKNLLNPHVYGENGDAAA
ncbi:MAG: FAD-binding protein [Elusimicrobiales bacterium]